MTFFSQQNQEFSFKPQSNIQVPTHPSSENFLIAYVHSGFHVGNYTQNCPTILKNQNSFLSTGQSVLSALCTVSETVQTISLALISAVAAQVSMPALSYSYT